MWGRKPVQLNETVKMTMEVINEFHRRLIKVEQVVEKYEMDFCDTYRMINRMSSELREIKKPKGE